MPAGTRGGGPAGAARRGRADQCVAMFRRQRHQPIYESLSSRQLHYRRSPETNPMPTQRPLATGCPPAERLACLHATLAATRTAILRCETVEAVYRAACTACINHAGFRLAWIGIADADHARLTPVEAAGPARAYVDGLTFSLEPGDADGDSAA